MAIDDYFVISDCFDIKGEERKEGEIRSIDLVNGEYGADLRLKKMSTCACNTSTHPFVFSFLSASTPV